MKTLLTIFTAFALLNASADTEMFLEPDIYVRSKQHSSNQTVITISGSALPDRPRLLGLALTSILIFNSSTTLSVPRSILIKTAENGIIYSGSSEYLLNFTQYIDAACIVANPNSDILEELTQTLIEYENIARKRHIEELTQHLTDRENILTEISSPEAEKTDKAFMAIQKDTFNRYSHIFMNHLLQKYKPNCITHSQLPQDNIAHYKENTRFLRFILDNLTDVTKASFIPFSNTIDDELTREIIRQKLNPFFAPIEMPPHSTPAEDGTDGVDGVDGADGAAGAPGINGTDGVDGVDGRRLR